MKARRIIDSIATRIILYGVGLILMGMAARYVVLGGSIQRDLLDLARQERASAAALYASQLDARLTERLQLVETLASAHTGSCTQTQASNWLPGARETLRLLLSTLTIEPIAGTPDTAISRAGSAMASHKARLQLHAATPDTPAYLALNAQIADTDGRPCATLQASIALQESALLPPTATSSGFLVYAPDDDITVTPPTAHDTALLADIRTRAVQAEHTDIHALAPVPATGWLVAAYSPLDLALRPASHLQQMIVRYGLLLLLAFVVLTSSILYLMFRPLFRAARLAERMSCGELPLQPLPVARLDEIGHLTSAFNSLLERLQISQADLAFLAQHDALTGLPNRALLGDRITQTITRSARARNSLAVYFIDLDGFKPLNDRYGHEAGDAALVEFAHRLRTNLRASDTLARIGGDEFVLIIDGLSADVEKCRQCAGEIAEKCMQALGEPFAHAGHTLHLSASIGIATGNGSSHGRELILAADQAMYEVKRRGGGGYAFTPSGASACDPLNTA